MRLRNFGKVKIPFEYNGNIFKLNVTKYSTCKDVVHMIIYKSGLTVSTINSFSVFEKTNTVERSLSGNTLVYNVWHSWGSEKNHFKFIVKSKENGLKMESDKQSMSKSVECDIDCLYKNQYMKMNNSINDLECCTFATWNMETPTSGFSGKDSHRTNTCQLAGKQMVLVRYLNDIFTISTRKDRKSLRELSTRVSDDWRDYPTLTDGCGSVKCRHPDSACTDNSSTEGGNGHKNYLTELDTTASIEFNDDQVTLDTAFVKSSCDFDCDEGIDVTSVDSVDLDAAFIAGKTNYNDYIELDCAIRTEVANATSPVEESRAYLIKQLFTKEKFVESEDDAMASFMHSRIEYY